MDKPKIKNSPRRTLPPNEFVGWVLKDYPGRLERGLAHTDYYPLKRSPDTEASEDRGSD